MYMQLNILVAYDHVHETHYVDADWADFATIAKKISAEGFKTPNPALSAARSRHGTRQASSGASR